jgi:hypothetical protein
MAKFEYCQYKPIDSQGVFKRPDDHDYFFITSSKTALTLTGYYNVAFRKLDRAVNRAQRRPLIADIFGA